MNAPAKSFPAEMTAGSEKAPAAVGGLPPAQSAAPRPWRLIGGTGQRDRIVDAAGETLAEFGATAIEFANAMLIVAAVNAFEERQRLEVLRQAQDDIQLGHSPGCANLRGGQCDCGWIPRVGELQTSRDEEKEAVA